MTNIYESEDFNIVSVYEKSEREDYDDGTYWADSYFIVKLQRLPLDIYPEITTIYIFSNRLSTNITKDEFLESAPSIILEELSTMDSLYDGSESIETSIEGLTLKFSE